MSGCGSSEDGELATCGESHAVDGALARTTAAFYRWRQARLKAGFKRHLQQILQDVAAEEHNTQVLQRNLKRSQAQ